MSQNINNVLIIIISLIIGYILYNIFILENFATQSEKSSEKSAIQSLNLEVELASAPKKIDPLNTTNGKLELWSVNSNKDVIKATLTDDKKCKWDFVKGTSNDKVDVTKMSNVYEGNTDIYGLLNGKPNDNYDIYVCKKPCTGTWEKISQPANIAEQSEPVYHWWDAAKISAPFEYRTTVPATNYHASTFTGLAQQKNDVLIGVKNDGNQFNTRPDRGTNQFNWGQI